MAAATPAPTPRLIKHYKGETIVPAQPQRIVTLFPPALNNLLALGVKPVAAISVHTGARMKETSHE